MKLRNKKTGEIVDMMWTYNECTGIGLAIDHHDGNITSEYYHSLAELNAEWEDYEEPREHYFVTEYGGVFSLNEYEGLNNVANVEEYKAIGNYFETEEEAEKAVEKLKAWKRLKEKGFRFTDGLVYGEYYGVGSARFNISPTQKEKSVIDDLNLLFGGEE